MYVWLCFFGLLPYMPCRTRDKIVPPCVSPRYGLGRPSRRAAHEHDGRAFLSDYVWEDETTDPRNVDLDARISWRSPPLLSFFIVKPQALFSLVWKTNCAVPRCTNNARTCTIRRALWPTSPLFPPTQRPPQPIVLSQCLPSPPPPHILIQKHAPLGH